MTTLGLPFYIFKPVFDPASLHRKSLLQVGVVVVVVVAIAMQNSFEISYPLQAPTGDPFRFYEPPVPKQKSRRPKPKTAPVAPELISTETGTSSHSY